MSPPSSSRDPTAFHFEGFDNPTTTPVPDVVFDRLLAHLGEAELKALLYIIRRTFGFKKDRDPISFNQFLRGIVTRDGRQLDEGCGLRNRTALSKALKSLEEKGIVISEKGEDERGENVTTVYRLRFRDDHGDVVRDPYHPPSHHDQGVVRETHHPSTQRAPHVVREPYPQQTVQQTDLQETDGIRNSNDTIAQFRTRRLDEADTRPPRGAGKRRDPDPVIENMIRDFSTEFHDSGSLRSNLTRARNLMDESGLEVDDFIDVLYEARRITKRQGNIEKPSTEETDRGWPGMRNKMPYFWAVVEDLLGEDAGEASGSL